MRALVVGAGSVGTVLHRALEEQKGNEATFLLRPGTARPLRTKIVDARTGAVRVRERPLSIEADKARPIVDTIVLAVRADQLEAALDMLGPIDPGVRLAVVTPADASLVRGRYPGHAVVRIAPAFMAYTDEGSVHVWTPPLVKSPMHYDDEEGRGFAEELAGALTAGGVPSQARQSRVLDPMSDAIHLVLAGYALAQYDADALSRDHATLALVGDAIGEALALDGRSGFSAALARHAAAPALKAMLSGSGLLPASWRTMWRLHGPKIDGQTRVAVEGLVARAEQLGKKATALTTVSERLRSVPAPVVLQKEARS